MQGGCCTANSLQEHVFGRVHRRGGIVGLSLNVGEVGDCDLVDILELGQFYIVVGRGVACGFEAVFQKRSQLSITHSVELATLKVVFHTRVTWVVKQNLSSEGVTALVQSYTRLKPMAVHQGVTQGRSVWSDGEDFAQNGESDYERTLNSHTQPKGLGMMHPASAEPFCWMLTPIGFGISF
jgi:hypothetical protein